ncbi:putative FAD-dependent oxidoreductase, partial [Paenibacillus sp. 598K]
AAGTAAYIASQGRLTTREVPIRELQHQLVRQGAWLGEDIHEVLAADVEASRG